MTRVLVGVIDSGVANLFNLTNALKAVDAPIRVCSSPADLRDCSHVILPGVGAFGAGMRELVAKGLADELKAFVKSGRPVLGICLGMQLLCRSSEEGGSHDGLALVDAEVKALKGQGCKLPHYGWSKLEPAKGSFEGTILGDGSAYFVHSYHVVPRDRSIIVAETDFGGERFCSAFTEDNLHGVQFHPELSARAGLHMLKKFVSLTEI